MNRLLTLLTLILLTVEAFGKWIFALLLVGLFGVALAQDALPAIPGVSVPDSVWYIAATVIGIVVKAVASPLTQLLKTRLGFTGNATRLLYAGLSLLFVVGYGLLTGAFGQGGHGWLSAGLALGTALIKGYGDYSKLIQTSAAGAAAALPTVDVVPGVAISSADIINGATLAPPANGLEKL